jgi:hypothetical protein
MKGGEQSMQVLMLYGRLTPHLLGMHWALLGLRPLILAAPDLRQLHAAFLSAEVLAAELRLLTPLQQSAEGPEPGAASVGEAGADGGVHLPAADGGVGMRNQQSSHQGDRHNLSTSSHVASLELDCTSQRRR